MKRKILLFRSLVKGMLPILIIVLIGNSVYSQNVKVSGNVVSSDGTALIGATVKEMKSGLATITDLDGNYSLAFPEATKNIKLSFAYVGYVTKIQEVNELKSSNIINVTLQEDFVGLDEVVITGASTATSKKQYGNAISTVNNRSIEESGATALDKALSGKISGAIINQNSGNPDGGVTVTLRGYSTIVGQSDPLYIVDGVIIDNSSNQLLDLGGYSQNRLVDINPNDIDRIEILKGAAAAAIYGSQASNGIVQIFTKKGKMGKPKISFSTSANLNTLRKEIQENMYPKVWENLTVNTNTTQKDATRYKMQDYVFSPGYGNENSFSISGGIGNTSYYGSLSSLYNEGIIDNTDFSRYSARLNLDQIFNKWLSMSMGLNYVNSKSNNIPNGGVSLTYGALTGMNFNNNTYNPEPDENGNYKSPIGSFPNPLEVINRYKFGQNTNRMISSLKFNIVPVENMNISFLLGSDWYNEDAGGYVPLGSNGTPNGYARAALKNFKRLNAELNFNYNIALTDFIKSTSAFGVSAQKDQSHLVILTSTKISPFVETVSGDITGKTDITGERAIQGLYFQQTFGLWDKVFVTGAVRWDQASPFGINSRTQFYPKASLSYLISDYDFWKKTLPFINTFKIRASYGESGNMTALRDYERFSNYDYLNYGGKLGFAPSTSMGNEDVKPERQKETEIGFDISALNNRIGAEFSYYNVDVSDLLLQVELAPSTGYTTRYENIGTMNNKGFELALTGVPVLKKNLTWKITGTFSKNKNVVNDIPGGSVTLANTFGIVKAINGQPLGVHYGYYYHRNEDGTIWTDASGIPKRAVDEKGTLLRDVIADPNPDFVASLTNEVSFKKFTLKFQFDQMQGFDIFNFTDRVNTRPAFGGGHYDEDELKGLLPKGYNNAAYNIWERYVEDGSFIKLRELYLAYLLNPSIKGISSLNIYVSGRDLYSFDNYKGWDPESSTSGQSNGVRGFDFNEVPIPRTIKVGVNVGF